MVTNKIIYTNKLLTKITIIRIIIENFCIFIIFIHNIIYIGDWGLGIGDWVPNPQSPIPIFSNYNIFLSSYFNKYINLLKYYLNIIS